MPTPSPQPPYPLHPSIVPLLDPTYITFYNTHLLHKQQVHHQPISVSRSSGVLIPGASPLLPVGRTVDLKIPRRETEGPDVGIRVFTPEGERPEMGWPVFVWYHGGGWVLGNIDTENVICTNLCVRANCVVITVDYRLAPEDPYPAAVHDAWEALLWLSSSGTALFHLDPLRCAIGGSSAGGNLAAVMCHKAQTSPSLVPSFLAQLLIVPVADNTASSSTHSSWATNAHVPALPAAKMMWYRQHYLPSPPSRSEPEASPLLYPSPTTSTSLTPSHTMTETGVKNTWQGQPRALIVLGELDVLRTEGEMYAEKLGQNGVEVELRVLKGMPHPFVAMDGVLMQGRETIDGMVSALRAVFA